MGLNINSNIDTVFGVAAIGLFVCFLLLHSINKNQKSPLSANQLFLIIFIALIGYFGAYFFTIYRMTPENKNLGESHQNEIVEPKKKEAVDVMAKPPDKSNISKKSLVNFSGVILDYDTHKTLDKVHIFCEGDSLCSTNSYGQFSFLSPSPNRMTERINMKFFKSGYKEHSLNQLARGRDDMKIFMTKRNPNE